MKVLCVNTGGTYLLPPDIASGNFRSSIFHVTVGHSYTVYGIIFIKNVIKYLIKDDNNLPNWYPASLFHISSSKMSRHWEYVDWSSSDYLAVITFPELTVSRQVFDDLVLGEKTSRCIFFTFLEKADLEFIDPLVDRVAEFINGNWLQCQFCANAWEWPSEDEMGRCPACYKVSLRPALSQPSQ